MAQTGVDMQVKFKKQSALNVIASAVSAQALRRVSSTLNLQKATYESAEIRPDYQRADFRHGARQVAGQIQGEISCGTYANFIESVMRRNFTTLTALTGVSVTIAVGSIVNGVQRYTVTRAAGDFLAGGIKLGHVVRLTVGTLNAANINKNIFVVAVTATVLTVIVLNGTIMVAEGPIASTTVTMQGKQTFCPLIGHTNDFYSIEHWYPVMSPTASETFWDCKIGGFNISLPPSGMATIGFDVMGLDTQTQTAEYFTAPTAATSSGILAAVNGVLINSLGAVANITGLTINATNGNEVAGPVVGSNKFVDIVNKRHAVSGQLTVLFENVTMRDAFINETELGLYCAFSSDNSATAQVLGIAIDRLKLGGGDRDDSDGVKSITLPFTALLNSVVAGTSTENTTLRIQDSQA